MVEISLEKFNQIIEVKMFIGTNFAIKWIRFVAKKLWKKDFSINQRIYI